MKSYAIVLACGALALTATSAIDAISGWAPFVMICLYMTMVAAWTIESEKHETGKHVPYKKAA